MSDIPLHVRSEVAEALAANRPVVALESTVIAHGLPRPFNLDCARKLEAIVRAAGAVPATIGICRGRIRIGMDGEELERFASANDVAKVSRRDLAAVVAQGRDGATTVAGTMLCAALAGIPILATGGIGGVHRGAETTFDVSADLSELGRTPVAVVCAGAKSILDLAGTLEVLETRGVPVIGFGADEFPAFFARRSAFPVSARVDSAAEAARLVRVHRRLGLQSGLVIAVPIPEAEALGPEELERWIAQAEAEVARAGVRGKALTPFLLARLAEASGGRTLRANLTLLEHNAAVAARIACALAETPGGNSIDVTETPTCEP